MFHYYLCILTVLSLLSRLADSRSVILHLSFKALLRPCGLLTVVWNILVFTLILQLIKSRPHARRLALTHNHSNPFITPVGTFKNQLDASCAETQDVAPVSFSCIPLVVFKMVDFSTYNLRTYNLDISGCIYDNRPQTAGFIASTAHSTELDCVCVSEISLAG